MKKTKIDYHCHTCFSFDSEAEPEEVCRSAIEKGISYIAITDHCDYDCILEGLYEEYLADEAREEIYRLKEKFEGQLNITYGIELGGAHIVPEEAERLIKKQKFEFVLGSLHNLEGVPDFSFMNSEQMPDGLIRSLMKRNITGLCEIARLPFIDSIAHITYPNRYFKAAGRHLNLLDFEDEFAELFSIMIRSGKALEVNTSPYRKGLSSTMPEKELLGLYRRCGGKRITIGSDSHTPEGVGDGINESLPMLIELGFDTITTFGDDGAVDHPILL